MFSRCKVKPLKEAERLTIPRMELEGMVLGALHIPFLIQELDIPIKGIFLWSDSTIVLHQVRNDIKSYEVWVENRLRRIRKIRDEHSVQLGHVRTTDNAADVVSRGLPASELQACKLWWHGPDWLLNEPSDWPPQPASLEAVASEKSKKDYSFGSPAFNAAFQSLRLIRTQNPLDTEPTTASTLGIAIPCYFGLAVQTPIPPGIAPLCKADLLSAESLQRCRKWNRLLRVHAQVFRACAIFARKHLIGPRQLSSLGVDLRQHFQSMEFSPADFGIVEHFVLRKEQLKLPPTPRELMLFETVTENGLIRVKSRLGNACLPDTAKLPVYLHRKSKVLALVIMHYHVRHVHCSVATLLANVRMHYWFTHGRRTSSP